MILLTLVLCIIRIEFYALKNPPTKFFWLKNIKNGQRKIDIGVLGHKNWYRVQGLLHAFVGLWHLQSVTLKIFNSSFLPSSSNFYFYRWNLFNWSGAFLEWYWGGPTRSQPLLPQCQWLLWQLLQQLLQNWPRYAIIIISFMIDQIMKKRYPIYKTIC